MERTIPVAASSVLVGVAVSLGLLAPIVLFAAALVATLR